MPDRLRNIFDAKSHVVTFFSLGLLNTVDLKSAGELLVIALNAGFIIWRWKNEAKKQKTKNGSDH